MAGDERATSKLRVFISYSRDDLDFADQLDAALNAIGFDCTIDRHGISAGEDWKRRLGSLIRDADTVVFVLSPSSAGSDICAWEVDEAARLGKRIMPVCCCPLEDAQPPPRFQDLNYIFFYSEPKLPGSGFGSGLAELISALNTDHEWLREHTRYLQRATEWDEGGRPANRLLSGNDIAEAKAWAARRPKGAPELTAIHLDFIRASEDEETARSDAARAQLAKIAAAQEERAKALDAAEDAQRARAAEQRRRARLQALLMVGAVATLLFFFGYREVVDRQELSRNTTELLEEISSLPTEEREALAETGLNSATSYLLWQRADPERLDLLRELLEKYEKIQPPGYGVNVSGLSHVALPGADWPLTLHYSSRRNLDPFKFNSAWFDFAKWFAEIWSIPAPLRVNVEPDPAYPAMFMRLEAGSDSLDLRAPLSEDYASISQSNLPKPAQAFFKRFSDQWRAIPEAKFGGPFWVVPRWSLPVWNVSGQKATSGHGIPAFLLALALQSAPETLLTEQAVDLLLSRVAYRYPKTVEAARTIRGARLRQDLIRTVKHGRALKGLPMLLDSLSHYPEEVPETFLDDISGIQAIIPTRLRGPQSDAKPPSQTVPSPDKQNKPNKKGGKQSIHKAYYEVEPWLPPVQPEIRTYVGQDLTTMWFPGGSVSPKLLERTEELRDNIYRRFGLTLPGVSYRPPPPELPDLKRREFVIAILDQTVKHEKAKSYFIAPENFVDRFIAALSYRAQAARVYWLNAERVSGILDEVEPALREWLLARYSPTDLKIVLRAVVDPDESEVELIASSEEGTDIPAPAENSIRHAAWLLGSLVFWTQIEDGRDPLKLRNRLRETQRAQLDGPKPVAHQGPLWDSMRIGIEELGSGNVALAEQHFQAAIQEDAKVAAVEFVRAYANHLHASLRASVDGKCDKPPFKWLSREERTYLEDVVGNLEGRTPVPQESLLLKTCLFKQYKKNSWPERWQTTAKELLDAADLRSALPPSFLVWFSLEVLKTYDPVKDEKQILTSSAALLRQGIQHLKDDSSDKAFGNLQTVCEGKGPKNWCWALLKDIAELRPTELSALQMALVLAGRERRGQIDEGLEWARLAARRISEAVDLSAETRQELSEYARYAKANALAHRGYLGEEKSLRQAELLLKDLLDSPIMARAAHVTLLTVLRYGKRYGEALSQIDLALKRWPNESGIYNEKLLVHLALNQTEQAVAVADDVLRASTNDESLFVAAIARLMTKQGNWELVARRFIETDHPYVPYVATILDASVGTGSAATTVNTEAQQLLKERWALIHPKTWKLRIQGGDPDVWREMLIGYFLRKVPRAQLFDALNDEKSFAASDFRFLPFSRKGMLCEAYFYDALLAKSQGDKERAIASLQGAVQTHFRSYNEYSMAEYLLMREDLAKLHR